MKIVVFFTSLMTGLIAWQTALAEVIERRISEDYVYYKVKDDAWKPEGFENGISIPAIHLLKQSIVIDGKDKEAEWNYAKEVFVSLAHGSVIEAS